MFGFFKTGKKNDKKPGTTAPTGDKKPERQALEQQALNQFRETYAAFGKDNLQKMKMILETQAVRQKLVEEMKQKNREMVADTLKEMVRADKDKKPPTDPKDRK